MTNPTTLSRRAFLAMAGAAPFATSALAQPRTVPVGLELYSVRGELMKDLPGTVTSVAKMGYEVVEFYSPYFKWTTDEAKQHRKLLDDLGIRCPSTHNSAQFISDENINRAIELNQIIGSHAIILASPPPKLSDVDGWTRFADQLTAAADKLRTHKMYTGFHNHAMEWRPLDTGPRPMDIIAGGTPQHVILQLDVGTCLEAGADPVEWINANPGRTKSMHLKDWGKERGYEVAFGEGDAPWKAIFQAAESTGGIEYYLIEQERAGPDGELAMVRRCLENYKKLRST